jgi:hypothetical protein
MMKKEKQLLKVPIIVLSNMQKKLVAVLSKPSIAVWIPKQVLPLHGVNYK